MNVFNHVFQVDENTLLFENHFLSVLSSAQGMPGVTWSYSAGKR